MHFVPTIENGEELRIPVCFNFVSTKQVPQVTVQYGRLMYFINAPSVVNDKKNKFKKF